MKNILVTTILSLLFIQTAFGQPPAETESSFPSDPRAVTFYTDDVKQFWKLVDQYPDKLTGNILQSQYIDIGTIGLKGFIQNRIESGKHLSKVFAGSRDYYLYVRPFTLSIDEKKERFYQCFEKFEELYPPAVFPDVYFVIGANNTGGTTFPQGLIIGAERFGKPGDGHHPPIDIDAVDKLITHESVHFQQRYAKDNSLLAQCVREGAADFICELVTGKHSGSIETYAYGDSHLEELWQEFAGRMYESDWKGWLYYQKDSSRPKDLGYWMGYRICKAYYNASADKQQAIADILNIQDFRKFLEISKFNGKPR